MLLCEALSSCRGRGPHHVHKDRVGTWELSCLTTGHVPTWSASGRRGAVADDARAREVGLRHSSCEADEQGGAIRCGAIRGGANCHGAGGAKGGDQGECGPAKHAPGAEPGKRVTSAGAHTASSKGKEEGEVHLAPPPHQHRCCWLPARRTCGSRSRTRASSCISRPAASRAKRPTSCFLPRRS